MLDKIVFWGAGNQLNNFLQFVENHREIVLSQDWIIVDADLNKQGKLLFGIEVVSPDEILKINPNLIVVTPDDSSSIYEAIQKMKVNCKYVSLKEYASKNVIDYQYNRFKKEGISSYIPIDRIVVYTAISKGYDKLMDPQVVFPEMKYVCFTDDETLSSSVWDIVLTDLGNEPRTEIRKYKILPHKYFEDYDISIWVDGNMKITGDLREYISKYLVSSSILLFPHPERYCLYEEAEVCVRIKNDDEKKILEQISTYNEDGYPSKNGLFCGGLLVRRHNDETLIRCMNLWMNEIEKHSKRDQISLPYILWKNNVLFDVSDENIYHNKWVKIYNHLDKIIN